MTLVEHTDERPSALYETPTPGQPRATQIHSLWFRAGVGERNSNRAAIIATWRELCRPAPGPNQRDESDRYDVTSLQTIAALRLQRQHLFVLPSQRNQ